MTGIEVSFPAGTRDFSRLRSRQTGSEARRVSYSAVAGVFSSEGKAVGASGRPPNRGEVKNAWGYTRGPHVFQKSRSHLKILGARRVTCGKSHTKGPQILRATVQNLVSRVAQVLCTPELYFHSSICLHVVVFNYAKGQLNICTFKKNMPSELNLRAMTLHTHFRTQLQKFHPKEFLTAYCTVSKGTSKFGPLLN